MDEFKKWREQFKDIISDMKVVNADEYSIRQTFEEALWDYYESQIPIGD